MINFKDFTLDEMARKNPSQNPRVPAYDQMIEKGYDTDEYFFTFTTLKKVGINPSSQFDTPNGIYCFPAKEILKLVHGDMKNVPFVDNAPYIHVLKKKGRGIIDPLEKYSQSDYKKDMKKIYKIITETKRGSLPMNPEGKRRIRELMFDAQGTSKIQTPIGWLWNVTKELTADPSVSTLMGWGGGKSADYKLWYTAEDEWEEGHIVQKGKKRTRKSRDDRKGVMRYKEGLAYNSQGWNNLLRRLGYNGFVDRSGSGLIHSNEPTQAVFLSKKSITVVDMIENKSYEVLNRQSGIEKGIETLEKKHNSVTIVGDMSKIEYDQFKRIVEGDIRGCKIEYHKRKFYISGDGEISDFTFTGDTVRLSDITIDSGDYYYMGYIVDCVIMGGSFKDCELDNCEIIKATFTECDFPNTKVINNSNLDACSKLIGHVIFNCNLDQCRVYDCSFGSGCAVNNTYIFGKKKKMILDSDNAYMKCNITNVSILKGLFEECKIDESEIKGGDFNKGRINYSVVKDGRFRDIIFHESNVQGGKKV